MGRQCSLFRTSRPSHRNIRRQGDGIKAQLSKPSRFPGRRSSTSQSSSCRSTRTPFAMTRSARHAPGWAARAAALSHENGSDPRHGPRPITTGAWFGPGGPLGGCRVGGRSRQVVDHTRQALAGSRRWCLRDAGRRCLGTRCRRSLSRAYAATLTAKSTRAGRASPWRRRDPCARQGDAGTSYLEVPFEEMGDNSLAKDVLEDEGNQRILTYLVSRRVSAGGATPWHTKYQVQY